jgi:heme-degrading monooxygenase HmoA
MYIRVWEYDVAAGGIEAFIAAYGADGDWARLFERGRGHVGTELYRGTDDQAHFVTVDRWTDQAAWSAFLEEWREAYDGLDATLNRLSASQRSVVEGGP